MLRNYFKFRLIGALFCSAAALMAAPPSRITRPIDASRTAAAPGRVHHLAQTQYDRGTVDPAKKLNYMVLLVKPSAAQQSQLDQLLVDQQNPSSPSFRQWLTPEQFGARFGLTLGDQSKVVAWLTAQGFSVDHAARSHNWIAFSGTAAQVTKSLRTPIHQFEINGKVHFANTQVPSVPEAISDIVGGFLGLNDFPSTSNVKTVAAPDFNSAGAHYVTPADFATIYNVAPLYAAGIDGTGQSIAVVGESDVILSDISAFRTHYGLPVNPPKLTPYNPGVDPGFNGAELEANLDLEWAGAVAPKATIYYVYGTNAFTAIVAAVEFNVAPVISVSFGTCEINGDFPEYSALAQQGNAQGITIVAASGDVGAAGCDSDASEVFATRGLSVGFPAVLPEVTGVGGTQFMEGTGTYWAPANTATFGSALGYIPEAAWNESGSVGLLATGGGVSRLYSKPLWQNGPGVPNDNARHVPDVAFSASSHDGYEINYQGSLFPVSGTSCGTPTMAGIVALLNHYQVVNKFQKTSGMGNINPQLYRMAQAVPAAFHDVIPGDNIVQCAQGSPDCATGSIGYPAGVGYDLATGLGSVDANILVTHWNTSTIGSIVTLTASAARATLNDTIQLTAAVTAASGSGTPTGTVNFVYETVALGSAPVTNGSATLAFPLYEIGSSGTIIVSAVYSGDTAFGSASGTRSITITTPTGVATVIPSAPTTVFPQPADVQGLSWQTVIYLSEVSGTPAIVAGLTIDGVAQTLSTYFPSPAIPPRSTISANFIFRGLAAPVTRTFVFTGTDLTGAVWSRQAAVNYAPLPPYDYFNMNVTPLTTTQNPGNVACPWSVQLNLDDVGGYGVHIITFLQKGGIDLTDSVSSVFGTRRLDAFGGLQGTLCYSGITPPATDSIYLGMDNGGIAGVNVSFVAPPASPGTLSSTLAAVTLSAPNAAQLATGSVTVNLSDKTQSWTAAIYPANRTTSWLSASQLSGTGSGTIALTANGTGFEPGAYRAVIVFQSQNAVPQYISVPVMFVLGGSTTGTKITAVANAASYKTQVSPGMLLGVFGTNLANSTATASGSPLNYSLAGVSATVNGLAAPVYYASQGFLDIQVPFEVGAGPAVLSVNNNGQIAGFQFQIAPSSPGIFTDPNGNVVPIPVVKAGTVLALYVTGTGDVSPALTTGYSPSAGPLASLPVPLLPVSVKVGGVEAFLEFAGIAPGLIGVTQINILVPASVPTGNQPVVVTVGGASSAPANIVVQ